MQSSNRQLYQGPRKGYTLITAISNAILPFYFLPIVHVAKCKVHLCFVSNATKSVFLPSKQITETVSVK